MVPQKINPSLAQREKKEKKNKMKKNEVFCFDLPHLTLFLHNKLP